MPADNISEAATERDRAKIAELTSIVQAVRERVRARYPQPGIAGSNGEQDRVAAPVADLMPIIHARDAAQAKIAAIGSVNPRSGGVVNNAIQTVKKTIARSLQWFVRDQISFNRETVAAIEAILEVLNDHNRSLGAVTAKAYELESIHSQWMHMRADWEQKLSTNEIQFLRTTADLQGAFQHRTMLMEANFREIAKSQHRDFEGALDRTNVAIQRQLAADLARVREEFERLIHAELRVVRQRLSQIAGEASRPPTTTPAPAAPTLDYAWFSERFRGPEDNVRRNIGFYKPYFAGRENVLDIGCGRGEFLDLMRESGIPAKGIDLSEDSITHCRAKGLDADIADLFRYLPAQPEDEFEGIFSSQVVEHIDPYTLPEMVRLCASRLRRGGVLAFETPNPGCLAIFATFFYLDPTHTRPVPPPLLEFYMREAGLGEIEIHELSPAVDMMPELASLPEEFRRKFFGGLDYAIVGRKL